jgi:hypothetical protein
MIGGFFVSGCRVFVRVHQLPIGSDAGAEVLYKFMKKNRPTTFGQDGSTFLS